MPLRRKGLLGVKENEKTLVRRKDNKRTGFRKTEDGDNATKMQGVTGSERE